MKESKSQIEARELTPDQILRRDRIKAVNARLIDVGRNDKVIPDDSTDDRVIEEAENLAFYAEVRHEVPEDGRGNRQERIKERLIHRALETKAPGFLKRLFEKARGAQEAAASARVKADAEITRVAALQERYQSLKERLRNDEQTLDRARDLQEVWKADLAAIDSVGAVVARFEAILFPSYPPRHKAEVVAADRHKLVAAVEYFPVIERVLLERIAGLKSQIEEIEREFL